MKKIKLAAQKEDAYWTKMANKREKSFSHKKAISHEKVFCKDEIFKPSFIKRIKQSENDIKKGRVKSLEEVEKELGYKGKPLTEAQKKTIEKAVRKTAEEYGEVLKKLGSGEPGAR